ncbi:protein-glutamate methylesterase/protein-glutamine glutaminase [Falsiroseomonas tokyonensis]|uniref:Protein-glutamate methylesterase/protein-glutamine glutaminase n=1 Tax=Falsiroseomonas tokyonensis TaxID=430521 RepID=A0ABV7C1X0_9PROT|nr:chemotaxis response regulator protein-glutamate methylesterase [Falsiroseomonas tokyonensis]MBU8541068.1 chemotaxis response regulator protein-glutamate methylesterase [Falsiroseomonas tokyonensis]
MPVKVLVIDDSALIRQLLTELLSRDPGITVVGTAPDPIIARERIKALSPNVLTLDIEMPRMDGLSFLERLMALRPMPVVVISTLTQKCAEAALRAMELGAVDYVAKPLIDIRSGMIELGAELVAKVKAAAAARPRAREARPVASAPLQVDPRLSTAGRIVAIGASTGGVETLQRMITRLPATAPALLVTQHMPAGFTSSFARRLDAQCAMTVTEAEDGRRVMPGHVYIAPGARHLELVRDGAHFACRLHDGAPVSGHRPSVDVLFASVAAVAGRAAMGIILTGMGRDGAAGLLEMRRAGARTLGQSEASCVIYGMPRAAMQAGAVELEMPLDRLTEEIVTLQ